MLFRTLGQYLLKTCQIKVGSVERMDEFSWVNSKYDAHLYEVNILVTRSAEEFRRVLWDVKFIAI